MLCDNQSKVETLLQTREAGQTPALKTIVVMDPFGSELVERGIRCGVDVVSMMDVEVKHALLGQNVVVASSHETREKPRHDGVFIFFIFFLQALGKSNLEKPIVSSPLTYSYNPFL